MEPSPLSCRLGRRALAASATLRRGQPPTLPPLQRQPTQRSLSTKLCGATRWQCSARQVGAQAQAGCANGRVEVIKVDRTRLWERQQHADWCQLLRAAHPPLPAPSLHRPLCRQSAPTAARPRRQGAVQGMHTAVAPASCAPITAVCPAALPASCDWACLRTCICRACTGCGHACCDHQPASTFAPQVLASAGMGPPQLEVVDLDTRQVGATCCWQPHAAATRDSWSSSSRLLVAGWAHFSLGCAGPAHLLRQQERVDTSVCLQANPLTTYVCVRILTIPGMERHAAGSMERHAAGSLECQS